MEASLHTNVGGLVNWYEILFIKEVNSLWIWMEWLTRTKKSP